MSTTNLRLPLTIIVEVDKKARLIVLFLQKLLRDKTNYDVCVVEHLWVGNCPSCWAYEITALLFSVVHIHISPNFNLVGTDKKTPFSSYPHRSLLAQASAVVSPSSAASFDWIVDEGDSTTKMSGTPLPSVGIKKKRSRRKCLFFPSFSSKKRLFSGSWKKLTEGSKRSRWNSKKKWTIFRGRPASCDSIEQRSRSF